MDKYFGRAIRRTQAAEDLVKRADVKAHERSELETGLQIQMGMKVASRVALAGCVLFMYKKGHFAKQSFFFMREIGWLCGGMIALQASDYLASEYMWTNMSATVRKYTNYNDNYYIDDKTYESMKEMYKAK